MFITGLIKFIIGLVGVIGTLIFLLLSAFKRTKQGKSRLAGITFFSTAVLIVIISIIEFQVYPTNSKTDQLLLTAYREAPLGGIWLAIYDDRTWELGYSSREITASGTYQLKSDTLILTAANGTTIIGQTERTSFVIESNRLMEVKNSGIRSLEIMVNKMNENGL
jgi:hypothetical protein